MLTETSTSLRVMTYNIHKGIGGVDRRYNLTRIVDVISHYLPDILFLQEVDDGVPRSRHDRQAERLAELLAFPHSVFQPNVQLKHGQYGNAILSRYPLDEQSDLDLTISYKKRRRALITKAHIPIDGHLRTIFLCNTHLGLAGFERTRQIKKLLAFDQLVHLQQRTPAIIGGDFNDVWGSQGRKLMFPAGFQCAVQNTKTFPAFAPVRSLDALYYCGSLNLNDHFAGRIRLARQASDHLPVIADFEITK